MNIKIAAILIVLTLIFASIFFYFYKQPSEIKSIMLTQDGSDTAKNKKSFSDRTREIIMIMELSKMKKNGKIEISWYKKTNDNKLSLIQENIIKNTDNGSGFLKISLACKNGKYECGNYLVCIYLNGKKEILQEFTID
ncbi:MAG: hypothetical protein PHR39_06925 [Actinomycetota bacterium]|nr:hypothetical protein [Actinomycetota bacterium]